MEVDLEQDSVREPAVAGTFYPADAAGLKRGVAAFLRDASAPACRPKALIVPHAGYIYSGPVAASAYKSLTPLAGIVTRVILLGPSHRMAFAGLALSSADVFRTPLGDVPLDAESRIELEELPQVSVIDEAHEREHSVEVHIPFLQETLGRFSLVPVVVGEAEPKDVSDALEILWGGEETLIVVSTDLSHYLDYDSAVRRDRATAEAILRYDVSRIGPEDACGAYPLRGLLRFARKLGLRITELDLRNSGDTAGSRGRVVGYGAWALEE